MKCIYGFYKNCYSQVITKTYYSITYYFLLQTIGSDRSQERSDRAIGSDHILRRADFSRRLRSHSSVKRPSVCFVRAEHVPQRRSIIPRAASKINCGRAWYPVCCSAVGKTKNRGPRMPSCLRLPGCTCLQMTDVRNGRQNHSP